MAPCATPSQWFLVKKDAAVVSQKGNENPAVYFLARGRWGGQVWGLELTSASRAGFLVQLTTVIVPVLEAFLGRRKLKPQVRKLTTHEVEKKRTCFKLKLC